MIGFYDTGKGGRHLIDTLVQSIPTLQYRFYEDTQALPLGDKTSSEIQKMVTEGVEKLFNQGCSLVILACNTASVHTIRYLQQEVVPDKYPDKNVLGVSTPFLELMENQMTIYKEQQTE